MPIDQLTLLVIVVTATLLYATRWIAHEVTSLLIIAAIALTNILTPREALAGFSSTATLTVGAMFVLSAGLVRTGALEAITLYLSRAARGSRQRLLLMLGIAVPLASAFINNTPVVVMLIPVILSLGEEVRTQPSKLFMPLSYFAILGGSISLIGTSTNILLDDLYRQAGGPGFTIFEFAPLGIIFSAVGLLYMMLIGERLLPSRAPLVNLASGRAMSTYISEITIDGQSKLIGHRAGNAFDNIAQLEPASVPHRQHRHRRLQRMRPAPSKSANEDSAVQLLAIVRGVVSFAARRAATCALWPMTR